jgi:predicted alpha/beta hydrolase
MVCTKSLGLLSVSGTQDFAWPLYFGNQLLGTGLPGENHRPKARWSHLQTLSQKDSLSCTNMNQMPVCSGDRHWLLCYVKNNRSPFFRENF